MSNLFNSLKPSAPLTVYKASAGSGKTFRLAVEFIKLLVSNPTEYRNTLAVTFTNKATQEMKTRVLSHLYGIWKHLDGSEPYFSIVAQETGLGGELIRRNAGEALRLILHHYSYFKVLTIDAFFQQVLRNLARELELNANMRVNIDDEQVESKAVDGMIESLTADSEVLAWISEYIEHNISEDKAWNVIGQIKDFGRNIFRDFYKQNAQALNEASASNYFRNYRKEVTEVKDHAAKELQKMGTDFFKLLQSEGLDENDFAYGASGPCGYFLKLRDMKPDVLITSKMMGKRVSSVQTEPAKWITAKKSGQHSRAESLAPRLTEMLNSCEERRPGLVRDYKSAKATLENLYQLRLLKAIADSVKALNLETGRFQLSDTQEVLNKAIDGQDAPFIYEKIGSTLRHIMIDEFQDTGVMQWKNFKVLLNDCISHASGSLLVGDVKQSIYRWRDADWQLLNRIDNQFSPEQCFIDTESLRTNRRSLRNIVNFNNSFFRAAVPLAYDCKDSDAEGEKELEAAYADVEQMVDDRKVNSEGRVEVHLLPYDNYQEETLKRLAETVESLLDAGEKPSNIGILTRNNGSIQLIVDYFQLHFPELPLVSDEAFKLGASLAVNILIDAMHVLVDESDMLSKANLAKAWLSQVKHRTDADILLMKRQENFDDVLPEGFSALERERLRAQPVMDVAEALFTIFSLDSLKNQSAYVCCFFDRLRDFLSSNAATIADVLTEWENNMYKAAVESDITDGIRMLTIHKSKGLEFPTVIMPFCDWVLEKSNVLWCQPTLKPFNGLPLVPVTFSKTALGDTIYESQYQQEHLLNMVDNLNLLYVAFTRARCNLYVFGGRKGSGFHREIRSYLIDDCLPLVAEALHGSSLNVGDDAKVDTVDFTYGQLTITPEKTTQNCGENVFELPVTQHPVSVASFGRHVNFLQSNRSSDFIMGNEDDTDRKRYIQNGRVFHELFSRIRTLEDVDIVLRSLESEGIIYDKGLTPDMVREELHRQFKDEVVRDWFSGRWHLFNERTILFEESANNDKMEELRPDRVMTDGKEVVVVDFKFGKPMESHIRQVEHYVALLREMGWHHVTGYLWYVFHSRHIVKV